MPDLYDTLGVAKDANDAAIKRAYRAGVKTAHPDAGGNIDAFRTLQVAYDVLSDKEKRARYDATGDIPDSGPANGDAVAVQLLNQLLQSVIDDEGAEYTDIIAAMRKALDSQRSGAKTDRKQTEHALSRIGTIRKKLSTTRQDSPGHLLRILDEKIDSLSRHIVRIDEHLAHLERVGELLDDYRFEPVERPAVDTSAFSSLSPDQAGGYAQFNARFCKF